MRWHVRSVIVVALLAFAPHVARAQASRADSAAILLDAARALDAQGQRAAADALLGYLLRRFGDTPAAAAADSLFNVRAAEPERRGSGNVQLIAWSALQGAFLGIGIPAWLGADSPEPYGIGLLVGGPGAFMLAQSYARRRQPTSGEAGAMTYGFRWGAWQAIGWRAVLEVGSSQTCSSDGFGGTYCEDNSGRAGWGAYVIGSLGGLAAGAAIGNTVHPTGGRVAFAAHGSYWGTWFAVVFSVVTDQSDDGALTTVLLGGDLGLIAGALAAPPDISSSRVRLTTALGIAGTAAGFGLDLIVQPDDEDVALLIPAATGLVGLVYGWNATRNQDRRRPPSIGGGGGGGGAGALLERCATCGTGGRAAWRLGAPVPTPSLMLAGETARGQRAYRPVVRLALIRAEF